MKRGGILNAELNAAISALGHGDLVVVADCGLPLPPGVPVVDLAVVHGVPPFAVVLDALLADAVFEGCTAATESEDTTAGDLIRHRFDVVDLVTHDELKTLSRSARVLIRTGEATPYANVVLRCGVPF
ncbi:D-ribose pyranase [Planctomonas psychrotolerans]|uniref:D-ribose pyranase n=1 Tax=Planctomonas psychrotolerans TaxID=2528712 RepID=UPI001238E445|nr:D-ribose pyranase [Planctomonas psychrotolerans]